MFPYILGRKAVKCPACGHKTFKPYIDTATGNPVDLSSCGRCNRENHCRYHLPPRQYLGPSKRRGQWVCRPTEPPVPSVVTPGYIPEATVAATLTRYDINPLVRWLKTRFRPESVDRVVARWGVGTAARWGGSTIFWQRDTEGRVRTGKIMGYDSATGCRVKNPPQFAWVHGLIDGSEAFELRQVFYGTHLLAGRPLDEPVMVVESEKTALIIACAAEDAGSRVNVVATGGCGNLSLDMESRNDPYYKGAALRDRRLLLLPDADMYHRWAAAPLRPFAASVTVVDPRRYALRGSEDFGDLLACARDTLARGRALGELRIEN